jgi:hypothetical protein
MCVVCSLNSFLAAGIITGIDSAALAPQRRQLHVPHGERPQRLESVPGGARA